MRALAFLASRADFGSPVSLPVSGSAGTAEIIRSRLAVALSCPVALRALPGIDPADWTGIVLPATRHAAARAWLLGYQQGERDALNRHYARTIDADGAVLAIGLPVLQ